MNGFIKIIAFVCIIQFIFACKTDVVQQEKIPETSLLQYVKPFTGTGQFSHAFPGAAVPFGQIQVNPETRLINQKTSRYHFQDTSIIGFSHQHVNSISTPGFGDILLLPFCGEYPQQEYATFSHSNEKASPGYYSVVLDKGNIKCELAASENSGLHRYQYPVNNKAGVLMHFGQLLPQENRACKTIATVELVNNRTIEGTLAIKKGDEIAKQWFCIEFSKPYEIEQWTSEEGKQKYAEQLMAECITANLSFGALREPLVAVVSFSLVDIQSARKSAKRLSSCGELEQVVAKAENEWEKVLSTIKIQGKDEAVLHNFYTAMYHAHLVPGNLDDAETNLPLSTFSTVKSNSSLPLSSLWNNNRSWFPLMSLVQPNRIDGWIQSIFENEAYTIDLSSGKPKETRIPPLSIAADALSKSLLSTQTTAMLQNVGYQLNWQFKNQTPNLAIQQTASYKNRNMFREKMGYLPADKCEKSVSLGLEMAYNDWCHGKIIAASGNTHKAKEWFNKGQYYRHYFDSNTKLMRAKNMNGSWKNESLKLSNVSFKNDYTNGGAYQWTAFVPHDVVGLRELLGGKQGMGIWLDSLFFTKNKVQDIPGTIGKYQHANCTDQHVAYLYNYTDRKQRTSEIVDSILYSFYDTTPKGLVGDDDYGQLSAWYILSALGFYQICPGEPIYEIGRPLIDQAKIKVNDGWFTIQVHNNSKQNKYVAKVVLNNKELNQSSFNHSAIKQGGQLDIYMISGDNL